MAKAIQDEEKEFHREKESILANITKAANVAHKGADTNTTLEHVDYMISRMSTFKRKMENLHDEEKELHVATRRRLEHLQEIYSMESLVDVKYGEWSRVRLDRYLVEYLVRQGYVESARALAEEKGILNLVDLGVFDRCERIAAGLRNGKLDEALAWSKEYLLLMKKTDVSLARGAW